ncbi:carboxylesterase [Gammaproteobacteria bacterium 45_16_T64]|nr:carboxylesterase [Gammaproteobacteria bacterium 45_16_T64]
MFEAVRVEPSQPATATVIWLHGLGADGHDFEPVIPHLKLAEHLQIRFIFPHAPVQPVTCNGGMAMPSWYDILELSEIRKVNEQDLIGTTHTINQLIDQEIKSGIPSDKILLVGFSQGGAVAIHTALRYPHKLAGLLALSTYMPRVDSIDAEASSANKDIIIHMAHGDHDDMVTPRASKKAFDDLIAHKYSVTWDNYPMAHELCLREIRDIGRWMEELLS